MNILNGKPNFLTPKVQGRARGGPAVQFCHREKFGRSVSYTCWAYRSSQKWRTAMPCHLGLRSVVVPYVVGLSQTGWARVRQYRKRTTVSTISERDG